MKQFYLVSMVRKKIMKSLDGKKHEGNDLCKKKAEQKQPLLKIRRSNCFAA
jgi:hypothetical protein